MTTISDQPPAALEPDLEAEPWQQRLEVIAILLVVTAVVAVLGRLLTSYEQATFTSYVGDDIDLLDVVRTTAVSVGPWTAAAVLVAFLLVTLGPGNRISGRGVFVLRVLVVVGLLVAGMVALGALLILVGDDPSSTGTLQQMGSSARFGGRVERLGFAAPLFVASATAGYVAWCAFSTLGEGASSDVESDGTSEDRESDAVVDAEEA